MTKFAETFRASALQGLNLLARTGVPGLAYL
jgi:hypothetical protein